MDYRGWDTHSNQRFALGDILKNDPENPIKRGLESGLRDVFGGQYGSNPSNPSALHCGLSALWHNLPSSDQDNIAITIAGEFGRQIRDNGLAGTDHGAGNLMLVIGGSCNGGIYGEMFPQEEIFKYQRPPEFTPHIDGRTEIDQLFSKVCDWVQPGSGSQVFPRMAESPAPPIELNGMLDDLFS